MEITASQIFEVIKSGGWALSPFLFWLWLRSDTERKELQGQLNTLSVDTIKIVTVMQGTVQSIKELLSGRNPS